MMTITRMEKNRIIVDQLSIGGPGTLEKFCKILEGKRQIFIAEQIKKSEFSYNLQIATA